MDNLEFKQVVQMAEVSDRGGLTSLPHEVLVEAIIMLYRRYNQEKASNGPMEAIAELSKKLICDAEMGTFTSRMREMNQQLAKTEGERDNLREINAELEDSLQQLQGRVDELEQELAGVPQVGRPERYDASFRARVKAYYEEGGHTYRETARHFNISTNTVGRFLKE